MRQSSTPNSQVVADSLERKARLYRMLTILWGFPSLGGVVILKTNWRPEWFQTVADGGGVSIRIEVLVALGLLLTHCGLVVLSRYFGRLNRNRKRAILEGRAAGCESKKCLSTNTN